MFLIDLKRFFFFFPFFRGTEGNATKTSTENFLDFSPRQLERVWFANESEYGDSCEGGEMCVWISTMFRFSLCFAFKCELLTIQIF